MMATADTGLDARGYPLPGTRWRKRTAKTCETRTVIDKTLGGSVVYVSGRTRGKELWRGYYQQQCTIAAWRDWARLARRLET
jgi:hypothetical protein